MNKKNAILTDGLPSVAFPMLFLKPSPGPAALVVPLQVKILKGLAGNGSLCPFKKKLSPVKRQDLERNIDVFDLLTPNYRLHIVGEKSSPLFGKASSFAAGRRPSSFHSSRASDESQNSIQVNLTRCGGEL